MYVVQNRPQSAFDPFQTAFGYFLHKTAVQIFDVILYDTFGCMGLGRQNDMLFAVIVFDHFHFDIPVFPQLFRVLEIDDRVKPILSHSSVEQTQEESIEKISFSRNACAKVISLAASLSLS